MVYPMSPFRQSFNTNILLQCRNRQVTQQIQIQNEHYLIKLLKWLCTTPAVTSFRVNTLTHTVEQIIALLEKEMAKLQKNIKIENHEYLPETILLRNLVIGSNSDLEKHYKEIIVDVNCAAAVLRGAHVFAPGIMGMLSGIKKGDEVSIYADLNGECKKGFQMIYECANKIFIGNGNVRMVRHELFGEHLTPTGIAVEVTSTTSYCPCLNEDIFPVGSVLLQNIPSILCCHLLNPKPGDNVLDMCAAPGNKTTHIAALMLNKGVLIALDKTPGKIKQLRNKCEKFQANVCIFQADSTKLLKDCEILKKRNVAEGPPFLPGTFDRVLLDAPCSALGKRPQLSNSVAEKVVMSYVPLQRKLFENAVEVLNENGRLVYSTCTITVAENEGMVAWALKRFQCLELFKAEPYLGGPGLDGGGLSDSQRQCVQRFGPDQNVDSVGFFIACFIKVNK